MTLNVYDHGNLLSYFCEFDEQINVIEAKLPLNI